MIEANVSSQVHPTLYFPTSRLAWESGQPTGPSLQALSELYDSHSGINHNRQCYQGLIESKDGATGHACIVVACQRSLQASFDGLKSAKLIPYCIYMHQENPEKVHLPQSSQSVVDVLRVEGMVPNAVIMQTQTNNWRQPLKYSIKHEILFISDRHTYREANSGCLLPNCTLLETRNHPFVCAHVYVCAFVASPQIESTGCLAKFKVRDNVANFPGNVSDVLHEGVILLRRGNKRNVPEAFLCNNKQRKVSFVRSSLERHCYWWAKIK